MLNFFRKRPYWRAKDGTIICPDKECPKYGNCPDVCPIALWKAAAGFSQQGSFADAIVLLKRIDELAPDYPNLWSNMAACYGRMEDEKEALAAYRKAVEREPDSVNALTGLALALFKAGEMEEAGNVCESYASRHADGRLAPLMAQIRQSLEGRSGQASRTPLGSGAIEADEIMGDLIARGRDAGFVVTESPTGPKGLAAQAERFSETLFDAVAESLKRAGFQDVSLRITTSLVWCLFAGLYGASLMKKDANAFKDRAIADVLLEQPLASYDMAVAQATELSPENYRSLRSHADGLAGELLQSLVAMAGNSDEDVQKTCLSARLAAMFRYGLLLLGEREKAMAAMAG